MRYRYSLSMFFYRLCVSIALTVSLCACTAMQDGNSVSLLFPTKSIAEKHAPLLPDNLRMDVGIEKFEENYTLKQAKKYEVFAEVRKAEARYFPLRLKKSIEKTGYWNGVWIVPESAIADVKIRGKIIKSTGEELELEIIASDATGRKLLDKKYSEKATEYDYTGGRKPFDNTFTNIAEDLRKSFNKIDHAQIQTVKNNADLRFVNWIVPDAFAHHIDENNNHKVLSLPADNDPIYQQALRLREYDALFFDKLQDYYDEFYDKVEQSHTTWANESYLEISAKKKQQKKAVVTGLVSGLITALGVVAIVSGAKDGNSNTTAGGAVLTTAGGLGIAKAVSEYKKSKIHDEAIRELGASVESSLKPHTVEIEGKTIQLEGSVDQQYLQWHTALQEQYHIETQPSHKI